MTPDREAELVRLVLALGDKLATVAEHLGRLSERRAPGMDAATPNWLAAVRAANGAWAAALDAVRAAFPPGSEWRCGLARVTVTGPDQRNTGNVWVRLAESPHWQVSVHAGELTTGEAAT